MMLRMRMIRNSEKVEEMDENSSGVGVFLSDLCRMHTQGAREK